MSDNLAIEIARHRRTQERLDAETARADAAQLRLVALLRDKDFLEKQCNKTHELWQAETARADALKSALQEFVDAYNRALSHNLGVAWAPSYLNNNAFKRAKEALEQKP